MTEPVKKKPAGSNSKWYPRRLNKISPFQTSRRVEGNQGVQILCDIPGGSTRYHPSRLRGGSKGTSGFTFYVALQEAQKNVTLQYFEEGQREPAGVFYARRHQFLKI
ncbi:MAG: hypothetical protein QT05_C0052G0026 [archaeon GW2011_AR13]|nr:MAG: hypothetical protein QT05_C0052G0026 [archaeon GW2011_AR13]